jgi:hypothetical protein
MQYPVCPWIFNNYNTGALDLTNEACYRDLSKNMGLSGTRERIRQYRERYEGMDPDGDIPPFHFGSHFSSPAIIYQFLIRLQPFSEGAKILQNGKYDLPDRLFYSMDDSYKCCTEDM